MTDLWSPTISAWCDNCEQHKDDCQRVPSNDGFVYKLCASCREKLGVTDSGQAQ